MSAAVGVPVATASLKAPHQAAVNVPHSPAAELGKVARAKNVPAQNFLYGPTVASLEFCGKRDCAKLFQVIFAATASIRLS